MASTTDNQVIDNTVTDKSDNNETLSVVLTNTDLNDDEKKTIYYEFTVNIVDKLVTDNKVTDNKVTDYNLNNDQGNIILTPPLTENKTINFKFTDQFTNYMYEEIKKYQKKDDCQNIDNKITKFFNEFEYQFSNNKLNLYDAYFECGVRQMIDDDIKQAFVNAMSTFNFEYVDSIDKISSMKYTFTIGEKTDRFPTTIFLSF